VGNNSAGASRIEDLSQKMEMDGTHPQKARKQLSQKKPSGETTQRKPQGDLEKN